MVMRIIEARHNGSSTEVEHFCVVAGQFLNGCIAANGKHFPGADGDCLNKALRRVGSKNFSIEKNEVGCLRLCAQAEKKDE